MYRIGAEELGIVQISSQIQQFSKYFHEGILRRGAHLSSVLRCLEFPCISGTPSSVTLTASPSAEDVLSFSLSAFEVKTVIGSDQGQFHFFCKFNQHSVQLLLPFEAIILEFKVEASIDRSRYQPAIFGLFLPAWSRGWESRLQDRR